MLRIISGITLGLALLLVIGQGLFAASKEKPGATPPIDFNREIRSILSDNCFKCHGPDDKERKARLRFDVKEDALKPAKSGDYAIVPGDLAKSKLVERVTSKDPDEIMPPPKSGKKLTPAQIDLLKRWIGQGAPWQEHWAFVKPERPSLPKVKETRWPRNDIDYFVLARLEKEELKPSPEADKTTLVRRATLDLTGLPPTPQEVDAFLADKDPQAYDKLVDRLLNAPQYGEHMAVIGSTPPGMRTPMAITSMRSGACGNGATGSSMRSTATCRSTNSPSNKWPATFCRRRPPIRGSGPVMSAAT